jgi:2-methylisocitrate lyase-like PEP mutase family enzyme
MHTSIQLRELLGRDETVFVPGAHDALSAKIASSHSDVEGILHSGYGTSATRKGLPDMNFTSFKETRDAVHEMVRVTGDTPIIVDADTGYGDIANLKHTVPEIERTGAAGLFIEDQTFPKTCGLMGDMETISLDQMESKLGAALDARQNDEFVIIGRTDVYDEADLNEVIQRGQAYAEVGVDAFLLAEPMPIDELERVCEAVNLPVFALMIQTGGYDYPSVYPFEAYENAGVSLVSDVGGMLQTAAQEMKAYLSELIERGDMRDAEMTPMNELTENLGALSYQQFEAEHTD